MHRQYLLEHGEEVAKKQDDEKRTRTALHYAADAKSIEIVSYLVEHGADFTSVVGRKSYYDWSIKERYSAFHHVNGFEQMASRLEDGIIFVLFNMLLSYHLVSMPPEQRKGTTDLPLAFQLCVKAGNKALLTYVCEMAFNVDDADEEAKAFISTLLSLLSFISRAYKTFPVHCAIHNRYDVTELRKVMKTNPNALCLVDYYGKSPTQAAISE